MLYRENSVDSISYCDRAMGTAACVPMEHGAMRRQILDHECNVCCGHYVFNAGMHCGSSRAAEQRFLSCHACSFPSVITFACLEEEEEANSETPFITFLHQHDPSSSAHSTITLIAQPSSLHQRLAAKLPTNSGHSELPNPHTTPAAPHTSPRCFREAGAQPTPNTASPQPPPPRHIPPPVPHTGGIAPPPP